MGGSKGIGLILIILGVLAIVFGGFSFTKDETKAELGPIKIEVEEKERVNVPLWAGLVVVGTGTVLLLRRDS